VSAEEIGGAQVSIAVSVVRVDRTEVNGGRDVGLSQRGADLQGGVEAVEASPHLGQAEVADGEEHRGMELVQDPAAGDQIHFMRNSQGWSAHDRWSFQT